MKYLHYFLREIKNLFEFYLIPALAVLLPKKVYYPIFKFICSHTFFYSIYAAGSYTIAQKVIDKIHPAKIWDRNVKLLYLMDITDVWLAWLRPKMAKKLLHKQGQWTIDSGFLALSSHWGAGFLSLLDLKMSGYNPFFVFLAQPVRFQDQGIVERYYRKLRVNYLNKISGSTAIPTGGGYDTIKTRLVDNGVVIILFDAPKDGQSSRYALNIFDYKYNIASGFVNLICTENIPFQLFSVELDFDSGIRTLRINQPQTMKSEAELVSELSIYFEKLLTISPEHWFFWRHSEHLLIKSK